VVSRSADCFAILNQLRSVGQIPLCYPAHEQVCDQVRAILTCQGGSHLSAKVGNQVCDLESVMEFGLIQQSVSSSVRHDLSCLCCQDWTTVMPHQLVFLPICLLQSMLNASAWSITGLCRSAHITDTLVSFHWLRAPEQIKFKLADWQLLFTER